MGTDAGFHPDQARWHVGKPRLQLPARPLLPQHDRAVLILANDVERVLTDVDANHASDCTVVLAGHGVLLVFAAPCPASLAGRAGARPDHSISGHPTSLGATLLRFLHQRSVNRCYSCTKALHRITSYRHD